MSVVQEIQPRSRPGTRIHWEIVGLIGLLLLGVWVHVATSPEAATVTRRDIIASIPLRGEAIAPPTARAEVRAPYRAPVGQVYASVGERVRQGDVLAELSHPSAQAAYEQARREVKAAEAAWEKARRRYQRAVDAATQELRAARAAERTTRAVAQAPVANGAAGTVIVIDDSSADRAWAIARVQAAEQALLRAEAARDAALLPYRQRLDAARVAFAEAQAGRKTALLRAPMDGTVLALNARPGVEVDPEGKTPVASLVDLNALQVHAMVTAEQASNIKPGVSVVLHFRDLPGESFTGRVAHLTSEPAGPLRRERYTAIITFRNRFGLVKPGQKAHVAAKIGEARDVLAVPGEAVDRDRSSRPLVKVLRGGQWRPVPVEIGVSDGHYTEVRSGLRQGETIQVTPDLL